MLVVVSECLLNSAHLMLQSFFTGVVGNESLLTNKGQMTEQLCIQLLA